MDWRDMLRDACAEANQPEPYNVLANGELQRYGGKGVKGVPYWYVIYGESGGAVGSFLHGFTKVTFSPDKAGLTQRQRHNLETQIQLSKAKHERDQEAKYAQGRADSVKQWNIMQPSGRSHYLASKQVGAFGVRFLDGIVGVPLRDVVGGGLHSVQLIYDDDVNLDYMAKQGRNKTFIKNGRKRGCFHAIGTKALLSSSYIVICEGYATGASIHMASGLPVFVAFDCGNMKPVFWRLRSLYPDKRIILAPDDDIYKPVNAGMESAKAIIASCKKSAPSLMPPRFAASRETHQPTDWNDLHVLEGLDVVASQWRNFTQS